MAVLAASSAGLLRLADPGQRALGLLLAPDPGVGTGRRGLAGPGRTRPAGCRPVWMSLLSWAGMGAIGFSPSRSRRPPRSRARPPSSRWPARPPWWRARLRPPPAGRRRAAGPLADAGHRARLVHLVPLALAGADPRSLVVGHPLDVWSKVAVVRPRPRAGRPHHGARRAAAAAGFVARPAPRSLLLTVGLSAAVGRDHLLSTAALPSLEGSGHARTAKPPATRAYANRRDPDHRQPGCLPRPRA